jgi:hypothetical protein
MLRLALIFGLFLTTLHGQDSGPTIPPEATNLATLRALVDSMAALRSQLDAASLRARTGENDAIKDAAKKDVAELQARLNQANGDFEAVASGIDVKAFDPSSGELKFDLALEFNELLKPLVIELKSATEQPRVIEQLRGELSSQERRLDLAKKAVLEIDNKIKSLPKKPKDGTPELAMLKALQTTLGKWQNNLRQAEGSNQVIRYRLSETLSKRKSIWEILTGAAQSFFLNRGRNIVLGVCSFLAAFFAWRWLQRWFLARMPWHGKSNARPFIARVADILFHSIAFVVATLAALSVLYSAGDWLLLGLCLIALLAMVLAAKTALPKYYRQARLVLNLGEVREGECLIVNGIPWKVQAINMFTDLTNPALRDAHLRLPISQLIGLTSHPHTEGDPWFPCKEGDWVILNDGTFGKTVCMTPEFVQLVQLGGARRTYTTMRFMGLDPTSLAAGFRITGVLRLERSHQAQAVDIIPQALHLAIGSGLRKIVGDDALHDIGVEYRGTPGSTLEYELLADFDGRVADQHPHLQRALQSLALSVCNANNWRVGG